MQGPRIVDTVTLLGLTQSVVKLPPLKLEKNLTSSSSSIVFSTKLQIPINNRTVANRLLIVLKFHFNPSQNAPGAKSAEEWHCCLDQGRNTCMLFNTHGRETRTHYCRSADHQEEPGSDRSR